MLTVKPPAYDPDLATITPNVNNPYANISDNNARPIAQPVQVVHVQGSPGDNTLAPDQGKDSFLKVYPQYVQRPHFWSPDVPVDTKGNKQYVWLGDTTHGKETWVLNPNFNGHLAPVAPAKITQARSAKVRAPSKTGMPHVLGAPPGRAIMGPDEATKSIIHLSRSNKPVMKNLRVDKATGQRTHQPDPMRIANAGRAMFASTPGLWDKIKNVVGMGNRVLHDPRVHMLVNAFKVLAKAGEVF
jgi:hypothetical protein